jgi:hypothetical protein
MTKGVVLVRLSALETCNIKGWKAGDVLISGSWKAPRRIKAFIGKFVKMSLLSGSGIERVHTFPTDVERRSEVQ